MFKNAQKMKVVIPGGSGHLGTLLARETHAAGHEVVVLSRSAHANQPWRTVTWDGVNAGDWMREIDGADVVINLAGRSVVCRYTPANRDEILRSRVDSTRAVGEAIAVAANPPHVWIQMSSATIYPHRLDAPNDECSAVTAAGPSAWNFSVEVVKAWEAAIDEARTPRTRKVKLRSAIVMSPDDGGAFDVFLRLVRYGLGGRHGDGKQFVSWIHERDFVRAVAWLIEHRFTGGTVNVTAPNPLPNAEFMRAMREAWGARVGLPSTEWMLEIGSLLLRTETELALKSRYVVPNRLLEAGFRFEFNEWPDAARDLCARWKERTRS
jgi:uncharacterized protein (TIGR01777 family)